MFGFSNKDSEKIIYTKVSPKNANGYHCTSCKNCIASGYGNYTCQFGKTILIIKNDISTKEYYWCNGKGYESK